MGFQVFCTRHLRVRDVGHPPDHYVRHVSTVQDATRIGMRVDAIEYAVIQLEPAAA